MLALSLFVQFLGATLRTEAYLAVARSQAPYQIFFNPGDIRLRDDLLNQHFIPEFSPLAAHVWMLEHTVRNRNQPESVRRRRMQEDFPWKSLVRRGMPQDPLPAAGWDVWHAWIPEYVPGTRAWVLRLRHLVLAVLALAAAVIMYLLKRDPAPAGNRPGAR